MQSLKDEINSDMSSLKKDINADMHSLIDLIKTSLDMLWEMKSTESRTKGMPGHEDWKQWVEVKNQKSRSWK